jgi:hypothetical protein
MNFELRFINHAGDVKKQLVSGADTENAIDDFCQYTGIQKTNVLSIRGIGDVTHWHVAVQTRQDDYGQIHGTIAAYCGIGSLGEEKAYCAATKTCVDMGIDPDETPFHILRSFDAKPAGTSTKICF